MSYVKALGNALTRSLDQARHSVATSLRMDVSPPTANIDSRLLLYPIHNAKDLSTIALGCDADIGGLSSCRFDIDPEGGKGRFWGTLSSEVPRGAKIERSGYAGFRNKSRSTLFGTQTWDTTMHPYLSLRVRNRLGGQKGGKASISSSQPSPNSLPPSPSPSSSHPSSLRSALSSGSVSPDTSDHLSSYTRAIHALGFDRANLPGPKFFVNIQTDGPVTSDLFQHRLWIDEAKALPSSSSSGTGEWQEVVIPLEDFVLTNTGQVSGSQIAMMREKIRTVGISVVLETPVLNENFGHHLAAGKENDQRGPPGALKKGQGKPDESDWASDGDLREEVATTPLRGSRRGASFNFDLAIDRIEAISEEALGRRQD